MTHVLCRTADENSAVRTRRRGSGQERGPSADSPDGKWTALIKDNNVFIRPKDGGEEIQLSTDGVEGNAYGRLSWSPDSKTLVAFRIEPGDGKEVYLIESSPAGGGRAKFSQRPYSLPGDKFTMYELNLFDVESRKQIKPEVDKLELDWGTPRLRWKKDQRHFAYEKVDRGHQRFRVIEVDAHTGQARNLIDERDRDLHLDRPHGEPGALRWSPGWTRATRSSTSPSGTAGGICISWTPRRARSATRSPRANGSSAASTGSTRTPGRSGSTPAARTPDQDPYFLHYYRVNFDGSGLVALTEGNGNHSIQYSPDRRYLIDTYSRVDTPPVHELRRVSDGKLVCPLEKADISELIAKGWTAPEVFVAKGRDGKTDIWGILCRPKDFDPGKKYPVIEQIYAGPQSSYVPKSFSPTSRFTSLTDLGFVVVQMDGMGTANRSKAFHDVCWHNLKDAGFPDRILWHQAAAQKYPWYDITRVGVYGNSAGGQNAAGAVLFHPEFYKAAVASCGCHDNRMDKASWNEQWMGYPVGPCYAECSNIDNAHRLQGKLFLIVGEMDNNVPPESTMRFVDALIKAGQGLRPARRARRRPRHGRRLRPAADAGFLRAKPARRRAAGPQRHVTPRNDGKLTGRREEA